MCGVSQGLFFTLQFCLKYNFLSPCKSEGDDMQKMNRLERNNLCFISGRPNIGHSGSEALFGFQSKSRVKCNSNTMGLSCM